MGRGKSRYCATTKGKVAILVDGGFYLKRAKALFGDKSGIERADELHSYCLRHLQVPNSEEYNDLYRIFYYDCPPIETPIYHPFLKKQIQMKKNPRHLWSQEFFDRLANKRKVALRFGELQERESSFRIRDKSMRALLNGTKTLDDLTELDFELDLIQKGVDMRIGLDIASMAFKDRVSQIVLISGDSDFVPAAKHARREGIDFILDPLWQGIRPELNKHIDGKRSCVDRHPYRDPLCNKTKEDFDIKGESE